jgi:hypothetical protein
MGRSVLSQETDSAGPTSIWLTHLDLGLHRGLDYQPGTQAGEVRDDLRQLKRPVEQGVDVATDLLGT